MAEQDSEIHVFELEEKFSKEIADSGNQLLKRFLEVAIALELLLLFLGLFFRAAEPWVSFVVASAAITGRLLIARGKFVLARQVSLYPAALALLILPFVLAGARTPALAYGGALALMFGWFFGRRHMLSLFIVQEAVTLGLYAAESAGLYAPEVAKLDLGRIAITYAAATGFLVLTAWHLFRQLEKRYAEEDLLRRRLHVANATIGRTLKVTKTELQTAEDSVVRITQEYEKSLPFAVMASVTPAIAHDLNTPIGNIGIAASTLTERISHFKSLVTSGNLRKSDLNGLLAEMEQGIEIIDSSQSRAAELVSSLKHMSIDQATQRRRQFDLPELVHDALTTMMPVLKRNHISVTTEVPHLQFDSFPGPLGQVLVNLIQNAVVHGLDEASEGKIQIIASGIDNDFVRISVIDNGKGMAEEVQSRLFEAFFTTRAGSGGSGIGLSFSKRLVHDVLGGSIACTSKLGSGTTFYLDVPCTAPHQ